MKKRFLPLVCFIGTLAFTLLATFVPLNGVTQADISNLFFTIITPIGFTFSIWTIIYLSWFIVSMMVAFKDIQINKEQKLLFSISMVLTGVWLIPWHFSHIGLSVSIMLLLLFVL
jgi:benzodiazapine receptor